MGQIQDSIRNSYSIKFLNKDEFLDSRKLMFNSLSPDIISNDTIILEYFTNTDGHYSYTLYESNTRQAKRYINQRSIRKGRVYVDSLREIDIPDRILKMVQMGKLEEIKQRGDAGTLTPASILIINIGVKNKEKKKFDFTTLVTHEFATRPYYGTPYKGD